MFTALKILREGISQAFSQLIANKLRSFLSMLGISIGIFCIIGVFSAVDSLESNVRSSIAKLGSDVIYIQKFAWNDPDGDFSKYLRRPNMAYKEYEAIKERLPNVEFVAYYAGIGTRTLKYRSNSVDRSFLLVGSYEFSDLFKLEYEKGRYFSPVEYFTGSNKVILGHTVSEALFGDLEPIGKTIKMGGRYLEVVGVIEKSGDSIINIADFDEAIIISYELAR
ncbi:MAG: ABC transporter permease, partial [Bacteroidota bacterium]